jgi:NDP-sugar pyrophosphorylase family protein
MPTSPNGSLEVSAVILAGGLGTRLRSQVSDRPKVMALVNGRPFLEYLLDQVVDGGIRSATLCIGYMAEVVRAHFGNSYRGVELSYSIEEELLGTGGALRLALPHMRHDAVLVMNGDSFCGVDLKSFASWHAAKQARASIVLTEVPDTSRYGRVELEEDNVIQGFIEKGGAQRPGYINAGIYLLQRRILEAISPKTVVSLEREVFPKLIGSGFYGWTAPHSLFIDIGTPESYAEAQDLFSRLEKQKEER